MKIGFNTKLLFWTAVYNVSGFILLIAAAMAGMSLSFLMSAEEKLKDEKKE